MMLWMEALGITRLGEGRTVRASQIRVFKVPTHWSTAICTLQQSLLTVDVSVDSGRGAPGLQKMTGSAGARPDMNRGDPKFYTAKRTLISRFKLYLFAPRDEIKIEFYLISTAISGKKI